MSKRYKLKRRFRYHIVRGTFDVPCWCGEPHPYFEPQRSGCGGTGMVNCYCGGDQCVCHNHGEMECLGCGDCDNEDDCGDDDYWNDLIQEEQSNRLL
jgi:hypothetical protein